MHIIIFVTTANKEEAEKIAKGLLEKKLVACVNIIDGVNSFFWWEGKIDQAKETLLIIKSNKKKFDRIQDIVKSLHSYQVPEIIAMPIVEGNNDYLNWIDESLR